MLPWLAFGKTIEEMKLFPRQVDDTKYPVADVRCPMNWEHPDVLLPIARPGRIAPEHVISGIVTYPRKIVS